MTDDRLTPEERAVIEAAEQYEKSCDPMRLSPPATVGDVVIGAVRSYHDSQQKWREYELGIMGPGRMFIPTGSLSSGQTDRVLALLNAGERALACDK